MGRYTLLAVLLATSSVYAAAETTSHPVTATSEQPGAWRGLRVPDYPGATGLSVSTDDDEYELYFRSGDSLQQVFNYYRDFLERQGFRLRNSDTKDGGQTLEANLMREQGGPNDSIELDAKLRDGRYKVEIEFDD